MNVSDVVAREKARLGLGAEASLSGDGETHSAGEASPDLSQAGPLPEDISPHPKSVNDLRAEAGSKTKGPSATSLAVSTLDLKLDQYGVLMLCRVTPAGRLEVTVAESQAALDAIALAVASSTGSTPSHELLKRELAPVRARAREAGRTVYVHNRVARDGTGGYLVDLGTPDGQVAHITALGWSASPHKATAFRRGASYGTLSVPDAVESPVEAWTRLTAWLCSRGVSTRMASIVAVMLVDWLRPDTPNPIAEAVGSAGSGKTTLAEQAASLVDPTTTLGLSSVKLCEDAVAAAASNRYVLAHDNAGKPLKEDEQDLLCKVATKTVITARRFYSQSEEFAVEVCAPVIITAILPVITRADARSRTIRIKVAKRLTFASAREVEAEFETERAQLTGALFTLLSAGLAGLEQARSRHYRHRLIDFDQLGEAITAAVGWEPGEFQTLMAEHRRETAEDAADASPVVVAVKEIIDQFRPRAIASASPPRQADWIVIHHKSVGFALNHPDGSLQVWVTLKHLHSVVYARHSSFSSSERSTSNSLTAQEPTLSALGISLTRRKFRGGKLLQFNMEASL